MEKQKMGIIKSTKNFLKSVLITFKMMELIMYYCLFYIDHPVYVDRENCTVCAKIEEMTKKQIVKRSILALFVSAILLFMMFAAMLTAKELSIVTCVAEIMFAGLIVIASRDLVNTIIRKA